MRRRVEEKQDNQIKHHNSRACGRELTVGQRVMVRNFRQGPRWIPGTVVKQKGPLIYLVKVRETQGVEVTHRSLTSIKDTTRDLLKSNDKSPMEENEFTNSSSAIFYSVFVE